ncbi:SURF1 family protein [Corynebacterium choanae]|uniref:SURF1-like protein n=1 Tax=Corynebacterium choanae TaxID=1862358 RepID=A0A3G6J7Q0_9CORY|nr:SURF1 family protein [Corynebacterium choanae]AZA14016.1 SURF1 family protein [Corynebacterium choanae]
MARPQSSSSAGLRSFFSPGWLITIALVMGFMWVAFTVLAPWQLGKNEVRSQRNERITTAVAQDPVALATVTAADGSLPPTADWTKVTLHGKYQPSAEALLRMQLINDTPSLQALTVFHTDSGETLLINRGFVAADQAQRTPPITPAPEGEVTLVGFARVAEEASDKPVALVDGVPQPLTINPQQIGEILNADLADMYVQLAADQPGVLHPIPLPRLESGPYLSYGIQWIAFGILAPLGLIYFIAAEMRERRREQAERAALADSNNDLAAPTPAPSSPETAHTAPAADQTPTSKNSKQHRTDSGGHDRPQHPATRPRRATYTVDAAHATDLWRDEDDERF